MCVLFYEIYENFKKIQESEKLQNLVRSACRGVLNKIGNPKIAYKVTRQGVE